MPIPIEVTYGSVVDQDVDVIVNAANTALRGGGGVDGAIHRAAGPELMQHLHKVAPHGAKTGTVVVTPGFRLKQKYIFHTPGPVWRGGENGEEELLRSCYSRSLLLAEEMDDVQSIAFCSISTGIYGFPIERAAQIALSAAVDHVQSGCSLTLIRFALFGEREHEVFRRMFGELVGYGR